MRNSGHISCRLGDTHGLETLVYVGSRLRWMWTVLDSDYDSSAYPEFKLYRIMAIIHYWMVFARYSVLYI